MTSKKNWFLRGLILAACCIFLAGCTKSYKRSWGHSGAGRTAIEISGSDEVTIFFKERSGRYDYSKGKVTKSTTNDKGETWELEGYTQAQGFASTVLQAGLGEIPLNSYKFTATVNNRDRTITIRGHVAGDPINETIAERR